MVSVLVCTRSNELRTALAGALGAVADVTATAEMPFRRGRSASGVVIAPVADCSPEVCERLARGGWRVVVLAAIPRDAERHRYLDAGATGYVPMNVGFDDLYSEINRAAGIASSSIPSR